MSRCTPRRAIGTPSGHPETNPALFDALRPPGASPSTGRGGPGARLLGLLGSLAVGLAFWTIFVWVILRALGRA